VTDLAITGALDLIAQAGGGRVESYPHDLTNQTKKMSLSFLYNGTRRLYERLGFTYDRPKGLKNCVMVKTVDPASGRSPPAVANRGAFPQPSFHGGHCHRSRWERDPGQEVAQ
jgi:hypothetical protein